jgi:PTS system mannitol-specific IIC component
VTTTADLKHLEGRGWRQTVQRFGGYLAGMIMPNIGAIIAWGLLTALFIPTGWWPNEDLAKMVDPMLKYLIPLLVAYTGGRMVHGQRGAVIGAAATVGVIVGADIPMILGAMVMGPLAAYLQKLLDAQTEKIKREGFEMLIDNFSLGILGMVLAIGGFWGIGPVVSALSETAGNGVDFLVDHSLLPIVSVFVEPAKVLFLNNAINHGVITPLATADVAEAGKSILFMVETNPGPGLGVLIAFLLFGQKSMRPSVPGAMIIHFLGGIHEIYFPYILMKPKLILGAVAGGASGLLTALAFDAGLVATPAPGSIFAYLAVTPKGGHVGVLAAILVATLVSFAVSAVLLGFGRGSNDLEDEDAEASTSTGA